MGADLMDNRVADEELTASESSRLADLRIIVINIVDGNIVDEFIQNVA